MKKRLLSLAIATLMLAGVGLTHVQPAYAATATHTLSPTDYVASELLKIRVDFPTSSPKLSLWSDVSGAWAKVSGQTAKTASSSGVYTFSYRVLQDQKVQVRNDAAGSTDATEEIALKPTATTGELDALTDSGPGTTAKATARFTPCRSGQATKLQVKKIVTTMTNENLKADQWETVATGTQSCTGTAPDLVGKTSFSMSNPLEIKHTYRAITTPSGGSISTVSNTVDYQAQAGKKNTGLATVYLNTNEGDTINTRTRYFEGSFHLVPPAGSAEYPECSTVIDNKGNPTTKPLLAAAKGRGNMSWTFPKKSYSVKLDKKADLCGLGRNKKWALVANHFDKSLLRNSVAMYIGSKLDNMGWTPKQRPVELYLNGDYRGSYMLIERIAVTDAKDQADGDATRVFGTKLDSTSTDITGTYLLEWDYRKGADRNVTAGARGWVGIKEPENEYDINGKNTGEGITGDQVSYINNYLDKTDAALFGSNFKDAGSGWRKYIDWESAVDYYIAMELMKPVDGNMWASVYMYKDPGGKLQFGPMWDFDLAAGSANRGGNVVSSSGWYLKNPLAISARQSTKTWFNRLNEDPWFRGRVRNRWNDVHSKLKGSDSYLSTQSNKLSDSARENFKKWSVTQHLTTSQVVKGSWSAEVDYLRRWLRLRIDWLDRNL